MTDWLEFKLQDLLSRPIQNGYSPNCPDEPNGRWILGLGTLTENGLDVSQAKPAPLDDEAVGNFLLESGDFLVSRSNTLEKVGRSALYRGELSCCSYPDLMMRFRVDGSRVWLDFLEQYLRSSRVQRHFQRCASGTSETMVKITKSTVENLTVVLPPLPEQKAIADTLSTWDAAIEKTERLIAAKERLFRRDRIDAIHHPAGGRASYSPLGEIFRPMTRKNTVGETNVLTTSAQRGLVSQRKYFSKSVASENLENYFLIEKGEFAYNRSSSNGYPYGAIKRLDDSERGVLSTLNICMTLIDPAAYNSDYFLHALESGVLNQGLAQICQEGARSHGLLNVSREDFFSLEIPSPVKAIQDEIAVRLNLALQEIDLMKKRLDLLKLQKRGLMQKLLTGTWRVPVRNKVAS